MTIKKRMLPYESPDSFDLFSLSITARRSYPVTKYARQY